MTLGSHRLGTGSIVVVHLVNPTEKFWGVLEVLDATGVVLRGISLASFDDWMLQARRDTTPSLGLATTFVPMFRVERIFLDEQVGEVQSYRQRFEQTVGLTVEEFLGFEGASEIPS